MKINRSSIFTILIFCGDAFSRSPLPCLGLKKEEVLELEKMKKLVSETTVFKSISKDHQLPPKISSNSCKKIQGQIQLRDYHIKAAQKSCVVSGFILNFHISENNVIFKNF